MDVASELAGRKQGHQGSDPGAFVESGLRRPASIGQLRGAQPIEAAARRGEFAGRQHSQDGVDRGLRAGRSPEVGPTAIPILFAQQKLDRHGEIVAGEKCRATRFWAAIFRKNTRELYGACGGARAASRASRQHPARPLLAGQDTFRFLLSWYGFPPVGYRVLRRGRRGFRKMTMMPPAAIQMAACIIASFIRVRSFAFHPSVFIIGKRYLKTCRMPGPAATISMDGNMKKKIGNTSLTPTLPARSSASWRRRTRKKSECVRRLSPMLVPKRSF